MAPSYTDRFITYDAEGDIILACPYKKALVEDLKELVEREDRHWNPEAKVWIVDRSYEKPLIALLRKHFGVEQAPPTPRGPQTFEEYARASRRRTPTFEETFAKQQQERADAEAAARGASMPTNPSEASLQYGRMTIELKAAQDRITALDASHKRLKIAAREAELARDTARSELSRLRYSSTTSEFWNRYGGPRPVGSPNADDPYTVLGVTRDAEPEAIEAVYRALSKRFHPDVGGDQEKMKRLNAAYSQIKSTVRR